MWYGCVMKVFALWGLPVLCWVLYLALWGMALLCDECTLCGSMGFVEHTWALLLSCALWGELVGCGCVHTLRGTSVCCGMYL